MLPHQPPCLWGQAIGVTGKHEGVAVCTGAIRILQAAGVLQSEGVIVCIDDPVVVVCKSERHSGPGGLTNLLTTDSMEWAAFP